MQSSPPTAPAIEARDLVKTYPGPGKTRVSALDGLTLNVAKGTIFALVGPNGAGKTTTVKILTTLASPDAGTATVEGIDVIAAPAQARRVIGVVAQRWGADPAATGRENLILQAHLYGLPTSAARARADGAARPLPAHRGGRAVRPHLLGRHAAPPRRRPRPRPPAARAVPRRADHRARPGVARRDVGRDHHPGHGRPGDRAAHHALPGRARPAGRPRGHRGPRPGGRRGRSRPAQAGPRRGLTGRGVPAPRGPAGTSDATRLAEVAGL